MYYSQKKYPKVKLGNCSDTISQSGCFITSFCNLLKRFDIADIAPDTFNTLAKKKGWYASGCLFLPDKAASFYGLTYRKTAKYDDVCIAETNYYKKVGVPQHFFLYNPKNGKRLDPLDLEPSWEDNNYPIMSYRVFTPLKVNKVEDFVVIPSKDVNKPQNAPTATPETPKASTPTPEPKNPPQVISEPSSTGVQPIEATTSTSSVEITYNQTTPCQNQTLLNGNLPELLKKFIALFAKKKSS